MADGLNETTKVELTFKGVIPGDDQIAGHMRSVAFLIESGQTDGEFEYDGGVGEWQTLVE